MEINNALIAMRHRQKFSFVFNIKAFIQDGKYNHYF